MDKRTIIDYIIKKYGTSPEYLWKRYPDYAVFRHEDNSKWFALTAGVSGSKLGLAEDDPEYYGAAEPPVRWWRSHLSGLSEPPRLTTGYLAFSGSNP